MCSGARTRRPTLSSSTPTSRIAPKVPRHLVTLALPLPILTSTAVSVDPVNRIHSSAANAQSRLLPRPTGQLQRPPGSVTCRLRLSDGLQRPAERWRLWSRSARSQRPVEPAVPSPELWQWFRWLPGLKAFSVSSCLLAVTAWATSPCRTIETSLLCRCGKVNGFLSSD